MIRKISVSLEVRLEEAICRTSRLEWEGETEREREMQGKEEEGRKREGVQSLGWGRNENVTWEREREDSSSS